jgi:hypothetical protein
MLGAPATALDALTTGFHSGNTEVIAPVDSQRHGREDSSIPSPRFESAPTVHRGAATTPSTSCATSVAFACENSSPLHKGHVVRLRAEALLPGGCDDLVRKARCADRDSRPEPRCDSNASSRHFRACAFLRDIDPIPRSRACSRMDSPRAFRKARAAAEVQEPRELMNTAPSGWRADGGPPRQWSRSTVRKSPPRPATKPTP